MRVVTVLSIRERVYVYTLCIYVYMYMSVARSSFANVQNTMSASSRVR